MSELPEIKKKNYKNLNYIIISSKIIFNIVYYIRLFVDLVLTVLNLYFLSKSLPIYLEKFPKKIK